MKKTAENYRSELANIVAVEMDENLLAANLEHQRADIRIRFRFLADAESEESFEGIDESLLEIAKKVATNNEFTYLLDLKRVGENVDYDDDDTATEELEKLFKKYQKKFEGKNMFFTVYRFSVASLLEGTPYAVSIDDNGNEKPITQVRNDNGRTYASFNTTYILRHDDIDAAFASVKNQLLKRLADTRYYVGATDAESEGNKRYRKSLRKKGDE